MKTTPTSTTRRLGLRSFFNARALLAVSALAALTVPTRLFAQVPTFNTVIATPTGSQPWQPPRPAAVGDFNGDGKLDALIVDGSPSARFMRGNGDSTFAEINIDAAQMTTSNMVGLPASLVPYMPKPIDGYMLIKAADVNGDGKLDAICVTTVHINWNPYSLVTVLTNTGNDASGVPQFSTTNYFLGFYDVRSLTVGDLNGDGKPDIIVGSAYAGLYIYRNNGDGTFTPGQVTSIMPSAGGPAVGPGVIVDVNGDGKADFVVTSGQANATDVFLGNGDGTLQAPTIVSPAASCIAVADLNKDGKPDLIEGLADGSVSVYLGNGNGTFGSPTNFPTVANGGATGLFISDVNGDGNLDVAVSLYSAAKVAILTGNGDGTLGAPNLYGTIPNAMDVTLADFTGDGKPEIASVSANGYGGQNFDVLTNTTPAPLPTQTLTILGGSGTPGTIAPNVEYYNPATGNWQPAYLTGSHPWGFITGTNSWINYKTNTSSDPGAGPTTNQTLWYLYRVRFTVPADAVNPQMTFSANADNFTQVAINGVTTGGSTQFINNANMPNVIVGGPGVVVQFHADSASTQAVHPGENTITLNIGDWGGLNGFNFRIDLSMQASQPLVIVPTDTTPPVITAPANIIAEATGPSGAAVTFTATATDNVDGPVPVTASPASGSTFPLGTTTVGLAASDAAHNTATASFTVTVRDTTPPGLLVPASVVAEATSANGAIVTYAAATASDAVGVASVTYSQNSGTLFPLGATTVNVTAKDAANNATTLPFTVTVKDTTAPVVTAPANQTLEATSAAGAVATFTATATDAVGVASITYSPASGSTFVIGTTTVTATAKDAAGNAGTATFTVTVRDTTPPVLTVPANQTLEATSAAGAVATFAASATDAVGPVTFTYAPASGSTFAIGATTVAVTAKDAYNNTSTGSFTVTVRDTTAPVITSVPANIVAEATSASGAVVTYGAATATDAVGPVTLSYAPASGSGFAIGATTVTVTAKDAYNNTSTRSFTVTVRDTTPPAVTASLVALRGGGDDESSQFFTVVFSATDAVGVKTLTATLNGVTVTNGQVVQLQTIKSGEQRVKREDGKLQIKATSFALVVTATDAAGNIGTQTIVPVFVKNGKDSEAKGGDDKSNSSGKSASDDKGDKSASESKGGKS